MCNVFLGIAFCLVAWNNKSHSKIYEFLNCFKIPSHKNFMKNWITVVNWWRGESQERNFLVGKFVKGFCDLLVGSVQQIFPFYGCLWCFNGDCSTVMTEISFSMVSAINLEGIAYRKWQKIPRLPLLQQDTCFSTKHSIHDKSSFKKINH